MGSFFGHALPGSFFIIFAFWWMVQTYRRYFKSLKKQNREPFRSSPTFPIHIRQRKVNIEAYTVVTCCFLGMLVELVAAPIKNHKLYNGNIQHGTMYFFFGLTALSAVVLPKIKLFPSYHNIVYVLLSMAYLAEGLLFKFHLFGRTGIDVLLHTLLVYTIFASVIVTLMEIKYRNNVLLPLSRAFLTLLQGTWFWQAAFVLYPPLSNPWGAHDNQEKMDEGEEHNKIMLMTCVFTWHMAAILISMTVCGIFIGLYYKRNGGIDYESFVLNANYNDEDDRPRMNGYTTLQQNSTQDDEV